MQTIQSKIQNIIVTVYVIFIHRRIYIDWFVQVSTPINFMDVHNVPALYTRALYCRV